MNEHTEHPVVSLMEEQKNITDKGGTMRLGAWKCDLKADSLAYKIYGQSTISERHRHRYEYNSAYVDALQSRIESVRVNQIWLKSWK
jgi:CTP synthase